ncbi:MAG: DUF4251 domain-containing protein [Bacteroidales bacterium]|jgi:hypothetical protein|nr:DUF4251 domain-containing protein [Bacteroidales bacterium]
MKIMAIVAIALLIPLAGMAQYDEPLTKEEKKALKKKEKEQFEKMLIANTSESIKARYFVLKADQIRGRGGDLINVNSSINFVAVEGEEAYVQMGSESGLGYNGVGGITVKGKITSFKVKQEGKHGTYNIVMNTLSSSGNLTIMMNVNVTGENASAVVSSTWGGRVEFNGNLVPLQGSKIHKGSETF